MRILGVCQDGPAEGTRFHFDTLPLVSESVQVTIHEVKGGLPLLTTARNRWKVKSCGEYDYLVSDVKPDNFGYAVTLKHHRTYI
jgi:hypothetical protein